MSNDTLSEAELRKSIHDGFAEIKRIIKEKEEEEALHKLTQAQ